MAGFKWAAKGCHARDGLTTSIQVTVFKKNYNRGFPGSPAVGTSPSSAKGASSALVREMRSHMTGGQKPKHKTGTVL